MSISILTMGKFGGPYNVGGGGGGMTYFEEKKKPIIRVSSVKYEKDENIRVIVTSIEEEE